MPERVEWLHQLAVRTVDFVWKVPSVEDTRTVMDVLRSPEVVEGVDGYDFPYCICRQGE